MITEEEQSALEWEAQSYAEEEAYQRAYEEAAYEDEEPDVTPLGSLTACKEKRFEIIGNIYDNPELLTNN